MGRSGREVQVTGMGCICAAGLDLSHCLKDIFSGQRRQSQPLRFKTSHTTRYPVFEIPDAYVQDDDLKDKNEYTLTVRYALQAAKEAMSQSGWSRGDLKKLKIGVCVGTTVGSTLNSEDFYREYLEEKHPDMTPVHRFLRSNPASALARELGFNGPCQTVVNACSSGTDAIGIGAGWIKSGLCDVVVAGGTDELCRVTYNGFASLMILDASACRPFDRRRQGLNLGEGAGLVVLESASLRHFSEKNNLGRVLGYGTACDAYHLTAPHPQGRGLRQALTQALQLSKTPVSEIAFVNAHGTGTRDNDKVEAMILEDVLPDIPFLSTKGYTGHALGAAGGIEAVFTLACLNLGRIPQSAGFVEADQDMTARPVQEVTRVHGTAAISQSLAFGGNNAVLILGAGT